MTASMEIHQTDVDGVPTFWAPVPGPMTCALIFRVGSGDETLPESGITHLVEHLAMHELHDRRYQMNAFVDVRRTVFHCRGKEDELVSFLNGICASLGSLPSERVEHERVVLHAESANRSLTVADSLATMRFGPQGLGKVAYKELGLLWLDADHVNAWARRCFTRDNAVLWLSGEVPAGVRLDLGGGSRMPQPEVRTTNIQLPGWYRGLAGVVGVSLMGKRSVRLVAGAAILDRRVKQHIRHELAVSYAPGASYMPISNDLAVITAAADGKDENLEAMRDGLVKIVDDLSAAGPTQREIDDHIVDVERGFDEPTAVLQLLDWRATSELTGEEWLDTEQQRERLHSLRPADIAESIAAASRSSLLSLPDGLEPPAGYTKVSDFSEAAVQGKAFKARAVAGERQPAGRTLIVGDDGVSLVYTEGPVTILFDRCSAMLRYEDGGRALIDDEGFRLHVAPKDWVSSEDAIRAIDRAVPRDRQISMPSESETPSAAIPSGPAAGKPLMRRGFKRVAWWSWAALSFLFAFYGFLEPDLAASEVPAGVVVEYTPQGFVDCGRGSAFEVAFSGADAEARRSPSAAVKTLCKDQAIGLVIFSVVGVLSFIGAVAVGLRARRRRSAVT